jgi:transcriptional regulator with XRE-family HTH domain
MYNDECRMLGKFIREERARLRMTQGELAEALHISRVMVTQMEQGKGLDSVVTRRAVAKALGVSPLALGVLGQGTEPHILYDTTLLQTTFGLHFEQYLTTGSVSLSDVDAMVKSIFSISQSLNHEDSAVLRVLHGYSWLGIDLAGESLNSIEADKYIGWSLKLSKEIGDPVLIARTLIAAAFAKYDLGELEQAARYAQRVAKLKVPPIVHATALMNEGTASKNPDLIDKALTVTQRSQEGDYYLHTSTDLLQIRKAIALIGRGDIGEAEAIIDKAEQITPATMLRRQVLLRWLRAQAAINQENFDEAAFVTLEAIPLAKQIGSDTNINRFKTIHKQLQSSTYSNSREVRLIGAAL